MIFSSLLGSNCENNGTEEFQHHQHDASNTVSYSQLKFDTCEEVEKYFKEYAEANNFGMRRGGSRSEKGQKIMQLFECSASRVNRRPKPGDLIDERTLLEAERKRTDAHCCKWRARAWRKLCDDTDNYYWYISSWNNEHSHDISVRRNTITPPESQTLAERREQLSERKNKKERRDVGCNGEGMDHGTEGLSSSSSLFPHDDDVQTTGLKRTVTDSEQKLQRVQKKRHSILLGICKEWCGINAESQETFERAHTLISNDLSVAQVELLDWRNGNSGANGNVNTSSSSLSSQQEYHDQYAQQQHNLLDNTAGIEQVPQHIEYPSVSSSSESTTAGGVVGKNVTGGNGEGKKRRRKDTITEAPVAAEPSSSTTASDASVEQQTEAAMTAGNEEVTAAGVFNSVDEEEEKDEDGAMIPHKKNRGDKKTLTGAVAVNK